MRVEWGGEQGEQAAVWGKEYTLRRPNTGRNTMTHFGVASGLVLVLFRYKIISRQP